MKDTWIENRQNQHRSYPPLYIKVLLDHSNAIKKCFFTIWNVLKKLVNFFQMLNVTLSCLALVEEGACGHKGRTGYSKDALMPLYTWDTNSFRIGGPTVAVAVGPGPVLKDASPVWE